MSVEETWRIDIVATKPGSPEVRLVISDHLDWRDFDRHCTLIQEKVNTYIAFVESGQLQRSYPTATEPFKVAVVLAVLHPPSPEGEGYLMRVGAFLSEIGMGFLVDRRYTS